MSDPTPTPPVTTVGFSFNDAVSIANTLGALASVVNPAVGGAVAAIEGAIALVKDTIIPAIQHAHDSQLSVAQQALLALQSAQLRAQVGAPPAPETVTPPAAPIP